MAGITTPFEEVSPTPAEKGKERVACEAGTSECELTTPSVCTTSRVVEDKGIHEGGGQPSSETPTPTKVTVDDLDWGEVYSKCPICGEVWDATKAGEWPSGVKVMEERMCGGEKLLVPVIFQKAVVKSHHEFLGHVGHKRLWSHMGHRFEWAEVETAKIFCRTVTKECDSCQASQQPLTLRAKLRPYPIPPQVMAHVAIDLFKLPEVEYEGQKFDTLIVCVDRHTGWVVNPWKAIGFYRV